jgi:threonine dehydrogenase-like Zn-dependent dehydrogenase
LPDNVVTIFHAVTKDLSLPLPWPNPEHPAPLHANSAILIWGGASSCGQYALQILSHWGYKNLLTTASPSHHAYLRSIGATHTFNYRDPDVSKKIIEAVGKQTPPVSFILDCIGSKFGSLRHAATIAQKGTRVAVLLPVILKDATEEEPPEYSMDVQPHAQWANGVEVRGTRTHHYKEVCFTQMHTEAVITNRNLLGRVFS